MQYGIKSLNGFAPEYISEISDTHNKILRSVDNDLLWIPGSRTKIYENSFTISAIGSYIHLTHISLASHFWTQANSADPDQTPQNATSDQGLHCLLTGISIRNRIKLKKYTGHP